MPCEIEAGFSADLAKVAKRLSSLQERDCAVSNGVAVKSCLMVSSQVVASAILIAGAVLFAQWQRQVPTPQPKFIEIRPSLYRLNYILDLHVVAPAPVAVWLVESSPNSWILIDGGVPHAKNQRAILQGIQTTLSSAEDTLRLVLGQSLHELPLCCCRCCCCCLELSAAHQFAGHSLALQLRCAMTIIQPHVLAVTHGHFDHTGVFSRILHLYPNVKFAFHENEDPFLSGGKSYADLKSTHSLVCNLVVLPLTPKNNGTLIPSSRSLLLKGQSGDVSDVFTYANWLPKGVLEYHAVPGHSPGQVAFYHKPTGSIIAADAFLHVSAWWPFSSTKDIGLASMPCSISLELAKGSQQNLAVLPGFKTLFPSHDAGHGASAKAVKEFVMA